MKRILRWIIFICLFLLIIAGLAIFFIDDVARAVAEKRIRAETGMEAQIGKFNLSFRNQTVHIENFRLVNPPEFGGKTFVEIPELHVNLDADAFRENRLHFREVRVNLAEVNVIETVDGRRNTDVFQKQGASAKPDEGASTNKTDKAETKLEFAGIDKLQVSLGRVQFTSERNPKQNFDKNLGVENRVFNSIKTEKDLETVGVVLAMQAGMNIFLQGGLPNPAELFKKGGSAGKETKEILKDVAAPLKK
jgi:uncharacterized protein involved in outer membrane biogenesis